MRPSRASVVRLIYTRRPDTRNGARGAPAEKLPGMVDVLEPRCWQYRDPADVRQQLEAYERNMALVPNVDRWPPWAGRRPYFTEDQINVLKWLASPRNSTA